MPATPTSPSQVKIQLTDTEQVLVDRRYDGPTAVNHVAEDVNRLMTSSLVTMPTGDVTPVATPTANNDGMDGSGSGSTYSGSGELGSGSVEEVGHERRPSFRRSELVPSVRRFIALCDGVSAASTRADLAEGFSDQLTDSVRALIAVLAITRRGAATYTLSQQLQLNEALTRVAASYVAMVTAAGPAVGLSSDDAVVVKASEKAWQLAEQLSTFLATVRNLKPRRPVVLL